jgi:hypothetical protein
MIEAAQLTKRQKLQILRAQLLNERASFEPFWRDLGDYILPMRPKWQVSDSSRGQRKNQKIINSTATIANRTLMAGMAGGITSHARRWFRLTTPDPDMSEYAPVKRWLHIVEDRMNMVFSRSNLYTVLPIMYSDLGCFGTAPLSIEEYLPTTAHFNSFPVGSYSLAKDEFGRINVFSRDFKMTVRQLISKFGRKKDGKPDWSVFSRHVRAAYDRGNYETWIEVSHVVKPNDEFDPSQIDPKFKRFESCYFETGYAGPNQGNYVNQNENPYLRESGYDIFPILAPRWFVTAEDVYATDCPGMTAIGDIKALQTLEKRKAQAIEKMVNPPMVAHTSIRTQRASLLPGDITYSDDPKAFQPAHNIDFRIAEVINEIDKIEHRIDRGFYSDLFLMLAYSDRNNITATEIAERKEEKLIALGPVLEQLNQDLLDPLIENTFKFMMRQGQIPPPPEEIQGQDLRVEYISMMAQAQKALGLSGMDRFLTMSERVGKVYPPSLTKINSDKMIEIYGESCGVAPTIIRTDEEAEALRNQMAQAQQAQNQAQQLRDVTGSVRDLSQADMNQDSALTRLIDQGRAGALG